MSKNKITLCSSLLREHFGEIVQKIAILLETRGSRPLKAIAQEINLPLKKVKSALRVLIQHDMADFEVNKREFVEYFVKLENVLLLHRYPRYIYCSKILYGDVGELLVEELLNNGLMTMEAAVDKVSERLAEATGEGKADIPVSSVKEKFNNLAHSHFIKRCALAEWEENSVVPKMFLREQDKFQIEDQIGKQVFNDDDDDDNSIPSKRQKLSNNSSKSIYWRVNFDRFHQYFRDQSIIKAVATRFDKKAAEIVRTLLRLAETRSDPWVETTNPTARHELLQMLTKETNITPEEADAYLAVLIDDSVPFVSRIDERSGGIYVVNIQKALQKLSEAIAVSVVQDKYGSKCCRIFRLLLMKKYLEQKQIEELSMIPSKDAKEYTYKMLQENFITVQEIPRTPDHAPSRTFFLFHVNLTQLCRLILNKCYKVIFNSICHREFITKEHKRLLEKKQRVDAIISTLQQSGADTTQIQEVEDMISPPEHAQLQKVKQHTNKLEHSEIQLDETIFTLSMWLKSLEKK